MFYIINFLIFLSSFIADKCMALESQQLLLKSDSLKAVSDIKKQFYEINSNCSSFSMIEKNIYNETSEGAYIIAFYKIDELKKIIATYYGEMGKSEYEYYFYNGEVIFIYNRELIYDRPIYIDGFKIKTIEDNRYYFYNGDLFLWIDKTKKTIKNSSNAFKTIAIDLKNNIDDLKKECPAKIHLNNNVLFVKDGDTVMCKFGNRCQDSKYIIKGSRDSLGRVIHVKKPKAKRVPLEE